MERIEKILYQQLLDSVRLLGGFDSVVWHPDRGAFVQGRAMFEDDSQYLQKDNNFTRELYKLGNSQGTRKRKDQLPPAVTLSGDKIVKVYGTNNEDITERFYKGPEAAYSMDPVNFKPSYTNAEEARVKLPSLINKANERNRQTSGGKEVSKDPFVMTGSCQRDAPQQKARPGTKTVKMKTGADLYSKGKRPSIIDNNLMKRNSLRSWPEEEAGVSHSVLQLNSMDSFNTGVEGMMVGGQDASFGNVGLRRAPKFPAEKKLRNMFVAGKTTIELKRPPVQSPRQSSYVIRKQYNEKLEKELMSKKKQEEKQQQKRSNDPDWVRKRYKLDSDTFYSSGSEYESDSSEINNALTLSLKQEKLMRFASTDVLLGSANFEEAESESDLETVLQGDEVFTRRTKNKMKKKRMRQFERYLTMLSDPENSETEDQIQMSALSDKELRAIRLKVNERKFKKKRDARTRFRRAGLVVLACIRLTRELHKIKIQVTKAEPQKVKSKTKRKKEKPGKRVRFDPKLRASTPGGESALSEEMIIQMSPKERFMLEFGWMLSDLGIEVPRAKVTEEVVAVTDGTMDAAPAMTEAAGIQGTLTVTSGNSLAVPGAAMAHAPRTTKTFVESTGRREFERPVGVGSMARRPSLPSLEKPSFLLFRVTTEPVAKKKGRKKNMKKPKLKGVNNIDCASPGEKNKSGCIHNHGEVNESKRPAPRTQINDDSIFEEVRIELGDLRRSTSTGDIPSVIPDLDLRDVIKDIDFPAKEIKLQIVERKRRRQRKKRIAKMQQEVEVTANRRLEEQAYARKIEQRRMEPESSEDEQTQNKSMKAHLRPKDTPHITTGVAWNQKEKPRLKSPSQEEIDKQLPELSRLFLEMRDCKYIRWSHTDQKIIARLREVEYV